MLVGMSTSKLKAHLKRIKRLTTDGEKRIAILSVETVSKIQAEMKVLATTCEMLEKAIFILIRLAFHSIGYLARLRR